MKPIYYETQRENVGGHGILYLHCLKKWGDTSHINLRPCNLERSGRVSEYCSVTTCKNLVSPVFFQEKCKVPGMDL